jgi:hypothetical protein
MTRPLKRNGTIEEVAMDSEVKEKWPAMDPYKVRIKM